MVDLAGSEQQDKAGATGVRLEQAIKINQSLTTLGKVITALYEGSKHVPYRESALTKVLCNSLGGNSKTALIVNCSPSSFNAAETLSTLRFGFRAAGVKTRPYVVEFQVDAEQEGRRNFLDLENRKLKSEVLMLKASLAAYEEGGTGQEKDRLIVELRDKIADLMHELERQKDLKALQDKLHQSKLESQEKQHEMSLSKVEMKVKELEATIEGLKQDNSTLRKEIDIYEAEITRTISETSQRRLSQRISEARGGEVVSMNGSRDEYESERRGSLASTGSVRL